MSDLVMRAAELIAVIVKQRVDEDTSGLRAQLMEARGELADARLYADKVAGERDDAQRELRIANIGRTMGRAWEAQFRSERDAARAELAGVAAQRDAHLSRSVELAARVTELEAALKRASCTLTATPAAVEVDGFRVGDLVRHRSSVLSWGVVDAVSQHVRVVYPGHDRGPDASSYRPDELARKPVKAGDTVRVTSGALAGSTGVVDYVHADGTMRIRSAGNPPLFREVPLLLVAVAP